MSSKQKKIVGAVVVLVIFAGLVWAMMPPKEDAQVAKVVALQNEVFKDGTPPMPRPENREKFDELRRESEKLTDDQRMKMFKENPPPFMKKFQDEMVAYFDLPEKEKKAALDKRIDEMEKWRKEFEKRRGQGGGPGGPPGGGPGGPRGGDPAKQNEMRKKMLDMTTPQQRAMFTEYFDAMQQRRTERGMPPLPNFGG